MRIDPGHTLAHYNLATLLQDIGDFTGAESHYRQALASSQDFAEAQNNLGICLQQLLRSDEAISCFKRAVEVNPGYVDAHFNLGNALLQAGQLEPAMASFEQVVALDGARTEAFNKIGQVALKLGRLAESAQNLGRALALDPQFAEAHNNLGNTLRELGRPDEAMARFYHALELKPDFPEALSNLANMHNERGEFAAGERAGRQALALRPEMMEAQVNLANALQELGAEEEAIVHYRNVLKRHPEFADAHYNLATALQKLDRLAESEASYRRVLSLQPEFAEAYNNLGNVLRDEGKFDEAEENYKKALALRPAFAEAHNNLGVTLQHGDPTAAEANCRQALALNPQFPEAMVLLADLLSNRGKFAEAEEMARKAIAIKPDMCAAWSAIPTIRKMTLADSDWISKAQQLTTQKLPPRTEAYLRHAMGKYHDDVKQFEQAFLNHQLANELTKRYSAPYDRQREETFTNSLIAHYDRVFVNRQRSQASLSKRPVFVVGMPRSGTSLSEQIIASHPLAFGAGELPFWESALHSFAPNINESEGKLSTRAADYLALLDNFSHDAQRIVDKMPSNFRALGLIHAALPEARIIHMERNPIDTCLSIYFQHFSGAHPYANDLGKSRASIQGISAFDGPLGRNHPADRLLHLPYEQLVDDPETWTRRVLDFIELPGTIVA